MKFDAALLYAGDLLLAFEWRFRNFRDYDYGLRFDELTNCLTCTSFAEIAGKTDLEQLQVDMIVDCLEDGLKLLAGFFFEKDETRKVF